MALTRPSTRPPRLPKWRGCAEKSERAPCEGPLRRQIGSAWQRLRERSCDEKGRFSLLRPTANGFELSGPLQSEERCTRTCRWLQRASPEHRVDSLPSSSYPHGHPFCGAVTAIGLHSPTCFVEDGGGMRHAYLRSALRAYSNGVAFTYRASCHSFTPNFSGPDRHRPSFVEPE